MRQRRQLTRLGLDKWFPTLARYCGLGLILYAVFVDKGANPALIPAATGLVFLKTVLGNGGEK